MLAIRLPQSIEHRLEKLARRTDRTKTFYLREAILQHLEDISGRGNSGPNPKRRGTNGPLKAGTERHGRDG